MSSKNETVDFSKDSPELRNTINYLLNAYHHKSMNKTMQNYYKQVITDLKQLEFGSIFDQPLNSK